MTEQVLFLTETFKPFTSEWSVLCIPLQYEDDMRSGYILPIGWEEELSKRGIEFTEIEIPIEQSSNDGVAWEGIEEPTSTNEP